MVVTLHPTTIGTRGKPLRARSFYAKVIEGALYGLLIMSSVVAVMITVGIVFSLAFETFRFFELVSFVDFFFGLEWSPQTAMRSDQVGSSGSFGIIPLLAGTVLISSIALFVAGPTGLLAAIYLAEYASPTVRAVVKPVMETLAGIPTVVYGFFAALALSPLLRGAGEAAGIDISSESALAAGIAMGIMIIPLISSVTEDVISAVPQSLREGSYGLGATQAETIRKVVLTAALPGIIGGMLLGASRAIGETMIVVMAAGLSATLTANPLDAVTTMTVQIVSLLTGDQEFESAKTLSAFAMGFTLLILTLMMNMLAIHIVNTYRERYE